MQKVMEADRRDDGEEEKQNDAFGATAHGYLFPPGRWHHIRHREVHDGRRHHEIDPGGDEEQEEGPEIQEALLPYHQGGDIPKGTEGTARIGGYHDVNKGEGHEPGAVGAYRQNHRAHQQGRGQVVRHRRDEEGQKASHPKEFTVAKTAADEPGAQGLEDITLVHDVDIGHGRQQEEEEFGEFQDIVTHGLPGLCRQIVLGVDDRDQHPDDAGGQHDGPGLTQVGKLLDHHEAIGDDEDQDRQESHPVTRQIEAIGRLRGGHQAWREQRSGKKKEAHRRETRHVFSPEGIRSSRRSFGGYGVGGQ